MPEPVSVNTYTGRPTSSTQSPVSLIRPPAHARRKSRPRHTDGDLAHDLVRGGGKASNAMWTVLADGAGRALDADAVGSQQVVDLARQLARARRA